MPKIFQDFTNSINVPISLANLANGASVASSAIDNSTDKYLSANLQIKIRTAAGAISTGTATIYILRSVDGGITYDDLNTNAEILGVFNANVASTDFVFSIDTNIVGSLPDFWKVAVKNDSGDAFDSTAANFSVTMLGKLLLIS
jgi:hypothetical protein